MNRYVLCHHGVKGMHWGIRRYQNIDGSLTPAGRKKAHKLAAKYNQVTGNDIRDHKKTGGDLGHETNAKKIRKMSDEDLDLRSTRLKKELDYMRDLDSYRQMSLKLDPPKKAPFSKRFGNALANDVVSPAAKTLGRKALEEFGKKSIEKAVNDAFDDPNNPSAKIKKSKAESELAKYIFEKANYENRLKNLSKNDGNGSDKRIRDEIDDINEMIRDLKEQINK